MSDQPLFASPDPAPSDRIGDYEGSLMLIFPLGTKTVDTEFGPSDVTEAHVAVITDEKTGKVVTLPRTLIFWKGVRSQLERFVGSDQAVAGRLRQGAGRNKKAWTLESAGVGDHDVLMAAIDSKAVLGMLAGAEGEQAFDEPF